MNRKIDEFCRQHPDFGVPHLMKYLTIANIVMWVLNMVNTRILGYMIFSPYHILHGQIWRLVSFIFIPPSTGMLAFISFYFYYFLGNTIEQNWGTARFTLYMLTGVVLSVVTGFVLYLFGFNIALNAQYIYLSLFFSFAAMYPDMQVLLFFIIPIKMKWLAMVDAIYFVVGIFSSKFPSCLVPVIAILNFFIFSGDDFLQMFGIRGSGSGYGSGFGGFSGRFSGRPGGGTGSGSGGRTINFRKASEKLRREQAGNLYHHKCAVCGRTDTDYPDLEFRFCSRCAGYHCFCQDHIYTHVHFTE